MKEIAEDVGNGNTGKKKIKNPLTILTHIFTQYEWIKYHLLVSVDFYYQAAR